MQLSIEQCYEILYLTHSCTDAEIKNAYKRQALKYHPDKNNGSKIAEEKFKQINNAYETLMNQPRRTNDSDDFLQETQPRQFQQQGPRFREQHRSSGVHLYIERISIDQALHVFRKWERSRKCHAEEAEKLATLIKQNQDLLNELLVTNDRHAGRLWSEQVWISRAMKDQANYLDRVVREERIPF